TIPFDDINNYYEFFRARLDSEDILLAGTDLTTRISMILSIHSNLEGITPGEVRFIGKAIDAAKDLGPLDIMLDIIRDFSLRGSAEAQACLENKIAKITSRKIPKGHKFVAISKKDTLFIGAVMDSFRQNSLMTILTGKQFPLRTRLEVMAGLAEKGYIDSGYSGLDETDGKRHLEMIERIYDEFSVIPAKIVVDSLFAGETTIERLKAVKPRLERILSERDYRVLIRRLAEDKEMSLVYYLFYQSPFQYPGTEPMSYERFRNMVEASGESLEDEDPEVVENSLKDGFIKVGMSRRHADQIAEAVLSGRAPLPRGSRYLDRKADFIPQKVDVLTMLGRSDAAEQAKRSFDSSIHGMTLLLKINDLLERIPKGIQRRFKDDTNMQADLAKQYDAIRDDIRLGVNLDDVLKRLISLNDEIFPPEGRKRNLDDMIAQAINKQVSGVAMWQDMIGLKKKEELEAGVVYLEAIDINILARNMDKMIKFLQRRTGKLRSYGKEIISGEKIESAHVFKIFFANLAASLRLNRGDPLYDIYTDLQGHLIAAYNNYVEAVSEKVDVAGVPRVVYVDFISKSNLIEFFRFADGAHCCLSSDPKVSSHYGAGIYERQMPRYLTNATSFWFQFTTDKRAGKQIGWFECWFGLDEEGRIFVGTELIYLSPGYHDNNLQSALLSEVEEILFSTGITKIGQAAFGHHAANALSPPDDYVEESSRIAKLQSLDDGEDIYEDADIESNRPVTVTLHVKHNPGKGVIGLSDPEEKHEILLEFLSPEDIDDGLIERLRSIEEEVSSEDKQEDEDYMRAHLGCDRGISCVLKEESTGRIVGYMHSVPGDEAWLMPDPEDDARYGVYAGEDTLYISDIALLPEHQSKAGMGNKLRGIFKRAREKGYRYIALHTESSQGTDDGTFSKKLQGMGFEVKWVERDWCDTGEDYDFLVLSLTTSAGGAGTVEKAFDTLGKEARKVSQLNSQISKLRGTSQNLMEVTKYRFCVPVSVLKNSPDITHALNTTGLLRQRGKDSDKIEFELVVTGVTDEDLSLIEGLNGEDIRKALDLPEKFTVSTISERQMRETAERFGYDITNPKHRVAIVKDFFSGTLANGEYMAIATDALDTEGDADRLQSEIEREFKQELSQENISVRVLVGPERGKSM
ncbi:MAG: hypothetical protein DRN95_05870, partial [Candidatus Hydrothermarchaeota archaeon]